MKLFALCTLYSSVQAFPLLVPVSLGHRHNERGTSATRLDVSAEEHLAQIKGDFDELQNMAKTLEVTHDEEFAAVLAEKFIEKAIEFTEVKEEIEEAHVDVAHKQYLKLLHEEDALKRLFDEAAHDAEDADVVLNSLERANAAEDFEKRREITISELSHNVEDYVESRFRHAKKEELRIHDEEDEAKRELDDLHMGELGLRATLEALKERRKKAFGDHA